MKSKSGQILVITLLVLTILSIITVTLVVIVNKDAKQIVSNDKYEQSYNSAENYLNELLVKYSKPNAILDQITTDFNNPDDLVCKFISSSLSLTEYDCNTSSKIFSNGEKYKTKIVLTENKDINNLELKKDVSYNINLVNLNNTFFNGNLNVSWDKNSALEFTIVYMDNKNTYQIIKDVYDYNGTVFTQLSNSINPYNIPNALIHPLTFSLNQPQSTKLSLNGINGKLISLKITPRLINVNDSVNVNITPDDYTNYPNQIRIFQASSYSDNEGSTPLANILTQVPLSTQVDSIFDYGLLTNDKLTNN